MLSKPTDTDLRNRKQQHRRQHSIPTKIESAKVPCLPISQKRYGHRRGLSLDQRRPASSQNRMACSIKAEYPTVPQHTLLESQHPRFLRPEQATRQPNDHDGYFSSPVTTPQRHSLDGSYLTQYDGEQSQQSPSFSNFAPLNWNIGVNQSSTYWGDDCSLYSANPILSSQSTHFQYPSQYENSIEGSLPDNFEINNPPSRRMSQKILDRVNEFENLVLQSPYRPITPLEHNSDGYFPPTPTDMPHANILKQQPSNARFVDGYDTSMEETIKPSNKQRAGSNIFDDMRKAAEENLEPHFSGLDRAGSKNISFDPGFMIPMENLSNCSNFQLELPRLKDENRLHPEALFSPNSDISSVPSAYDSSPVEGQIGIFSDSYPVPLHDPLLEPNASSNSSLSFAYLADPTSVDALNPLSARGGSTNTTVSNRSHHRRFNSTSTINLEESITETGITIDEIASYISGPDPVDGGKWSCLYPNCRKRFGRKENIKSHVQTHLGDRQFKCPFCKKCFVRQHDLKRHAKIHSGVKPYPCRCGNSFARHDALTRHRQRGMCIGAFEGTVKKAAKRGRPRKHRPDDEERHVKTLRTERKNQDESASSSISGCSESGQLSPRSDLGDGHEMQLNNEGDFLQASFTGDESDFQYMPSSQVSESSNNQYTSNSLLHSTESPTSKSFIHSQLPFFVGTVPDKTRVLQGIQALHNKSSDNSLQTPSLPCERGPSSLRTLNNLFNYTGQSNGMDIHRIPGSCETEKAYKDVFSIANQNPEKHVIGSSVDRNAINEAYNQNDLTEKLAGSFSTQVENNAYFLSSQGIFFGSP